MVGISDGNNDGKFKIQRGQGISQAIASELGLNAQQCKKLGSIWSEIFKEVDKQNEQTQIYSGGNDLHGPTNQNYVVHTNQVIEFSKEIWNKIVQLVNAKLGTNIQATEGGGATDAATETPDGTPAASGGKDTPPAAATEQTEDSPPAQHTVSMAGTEPNIKTKSGKYLATTKHVKANVKKLKGETQSNWAESSKMKEALNTVKDYNVAHFIQEYNADGSDIVKDIDGCTGWNKKDVYEYLTKKLIAKAKAEGIDISKYDIEPKTSTPARTGATPSMPVTQYPSLEAQKKFLNEVSSLIVENEFAMRYKKQITKANETIKQFADAPVENIKMTKPDDPKNGSYQLGLDNGSMIWVTVKDGKITALHVKNSSSPNTKSDLSYDLTHHKLGLAPDEKGPNREGQKFSNNNTIPFDKLKEVATELLKKMGVKFTKQ